MAGVTGKRTFINPLFDHLIGLSPQQLRHCEAERLGHLQVDDELEFCRALDRKLGRFLRASTLPT